MELQGCCGSVGGGYKGPPCAEPILITRPAPLLTTGALPLPWECSGSCPPNLGVGDSSSGWWEELQVIEVQIRAGGKWSCLDERLEENGRLLLVPSSTAFWLVLTDAGRGAIVSLWLAHL